jgi:hypothetical protein
MNSSTQSRESKSRLIFCPEMVNKHFGTALIVVKVHAIVAAVKAPSFLFLGSVGVPLPKGLSISHRLCHGDGASRNGCRYCLL